MSDSSTHDPKPAGESPAPSSKPAEAWLPPRLREKLDSAEAASGPDDWKPKRGSPMPAILTTVAILIVAAGAFTWWRNGARKEGRAEAEVSTAQSQPSSPAPPAGMPDSTLASATDTASATPAISPTGAPAPGAPVAGAGSAPSSAGNVAAATPPASTGASATTPARSSAPVAKAPAKETATASASASAPAPPAASNGFGLLVGTYLFEERANTERERLSGLTGLPAIVDASSEGGGTSYRVILGKFGTRAQAERRAGALIDSSWVSQAQVVARPK